MKLKDFFEKINKIQLCAILSVIIMLVSLTSYFSFGAYNNMSNKTSVISANANVIKNASQLDYSSSYTQSTNVQDALEELYDTIKFISFTINGTPCIAEYGMTWGTWLESSYNTYPNLYVDINDWVCLDGYSIMAYDISDVIRENYEYETSEDESCEEE